MAANKFVTFIKKHPIIDTIIGLIIVDFILLVIGYYMLDNFTHHNQYTIVPNLEGMTPTEANNLLGKQNLQCVISDSIYDTKSKPGIVLEQTPQAGAKIKDSRIVYITITSFTTQRVKVPALVDLSLRQGMSLLQSLGISHIDIKHVPSQYRDLVIDLTMNGLSLRQGERIPIDSHVTLVVGDGSEANEEFELDSIAGDGDEPVIMVED